MRWQCAFYFAHEKAPEGNRALFPDVMLCNEKEEKIRLFVDVKIC